MFRNILDDNQGPGTLEGKIVSGVVIDNNDPEKLFRVKVRLSEMHSGRPNGEIPWSMQFLFSNQGHTNQIGSICIPVIGAKVLIMFPEDDEHDSYYIADYHDKSSQIQELLVDYPNVYGHIDASGNLWLVNTLRDTVTFIHVSGSYTKYFQNGDVEQGVAGNYYVKAIGSINLDGVTVNINSGGAQHLAITPRTKPTVTDAVKDDY